MSHPDWARMAKEVESYISDDFPTEAGEIVMDSIDDNFDNESYNLDKWEPLSAKYAARKGEGKKILSDTGDLRSGIAVEEGEGELIITSDVDYAEYHQDGGSVDGRPPQRQFIPSEENPDEVLELEIQEHVENKLTSIIRKYK